MNSDASPNGHSAIIRESSRLACARGVQGLLLERNGIVDSFRSRLVTESLASCHVTTGAGVWKTRAAGGLYMKGRVPREGYKRASR